MYGRRKRNSSKVNLTISVVFHSALVLGIFFLAAREGMLGKKLKEITVTMAPKEPKKLPEPAKEKPVEPKAEPAKQVEAPKLAVAPPPAPVQNAAPPADSTPAVAPAAAALPDMDFSDGAKEVQVVSDPKVIYKGLVEHVLRSHWTKPEDVDDTTFVAEVELNIDAAGKVTGSRLTKSSGNRAWDNSVKAAIGATKVISRPPPKGWPATFLARFDVETDRTESVMQLSSR